MSVQGHIWQLAALPFVPLAGSLLTYLLTARSQQLSGWLATAASTIAFGLSVILFQMVSGEGAEHILNDKLWTWFSAGNLSVDFAFRFDHLTAVMCLIITGVGSLIHLYAIGYMAEDENKARFFCYLNLFLFAMLLLVLGDSLPLLFVGWEGVGLCSYLLIGFWFAEMPNAEAGQKAFVVNRIGDAGFLLGMFLLAFYTGTLNVSGMAVSVPGLPTHVIELAAFCLFIGAVGKSAQIPLFVWLPDAMAGPTPVSALIHAATMVTAGVYMIARMHFLYALAPVTLAIVLVIGTCTAFLAATIAIAQNDIKRVLAYSTVSQLGFMFMAMGAGAFSNGIYHVLTHAFFKACLFMAAGSVIIGCHHEQDMRHFGGLRKSMPLTFATYFVATFAIAGFPFTSGFFSKDAILWTVFSNDGLPAKIDVFGMSLAHVCWGVGAFTALLTAFYMTRSLMLTFFGEYRGHAHPHESPWVVTGPLIILAALSALFGFFFTEPFIHFMHEWTRSDIASGAFEHDEMYETLEHFSMAIAVFGMLAGFLVYGKFPQVAASAARSLAGLYQALLNKWWVDELYQKMIVRPLRGVADFLFLVVDRVLVDGTVNGTGVFMEANGDAVSRIHTGQIAHYVMWMFGSTLFFLLFYLLL